jgi:HlyD family secretion protein
MKPRRGVLIALGGALVLGAAVLWPRAQAVDVVLVQQGPITQSVVATGRVATPARIALGSALAATVLEVAVREGDLVRAGQVLLRLQADDAGALIRQAEAALAEAEARDAQVRSLGEPVAARQLAQAESNLQVARAEAERARQLVAQGFYAQSRVDDALRNEANAQAALEVARVQLRAQRPEGSEQAAARAKVAQAREALANARARAALLTLRAPADGVVLTRKAEPGDVTSPGKVLLELAQAGETRIYGTVDEKNLRLLQVGQTARAVADAYPAQPFEATLYYIAPVVDPQRGTVEIRFRVPAPPAFLRPDMTISVETVTGRQAQTRVLPAEAVRDMDQNHPWVLVLREGKAERVDVQTGLSGVGSVELLKGPEPGEAVILPASGAREGDAVKAREPRKPRTAGLQAVPQLGR